MLFENRVAVVTGVDGGMGRAIAEGLANEGATVVGMDRVAGDGNQPGVAKAIQVDVSSSDAVAAAFVEVFELYEHIDVLVNCVGIREISPTLELPVDVWGDILAVNLSGTFYCCQAAARGGRMDGGAIVNVASVSGLMGEESRPAYTASKHGVVGLTRVLARDLAPNRIRANAVCPGLIRTPLTERFFSDKAFVDGLPNFIPLGFAGEPRHIANAVMFLASDLAEYITGVALPVDGGFTAEKAFALRTGSSGYIASGTSNA
jgi:NAD(P)-dependent dehydrogenase (short-subunit alcohol dehydrogenase family)